MTLTLEESIEGLRAKGEIIPSDAVHYALSKAQVHSLRPETRRHMARELVNPEEGSG
jgi:hypothetical protein